MSIEQIPSPFNQLSAKESRRLQLTAGSTLFAQASKTTGMFYLVSGTVDLTRVTKTGHRVVLHRARATDTFAEASIFSDTYHCTATTTSEATIIEFKKQAIMNMLQTNIEFAGALASRFAAQVQMSRRHIELLSIRSADDRIFAALGDGLLIDDIASFSETIGLVPETVYRSTGHLQALRKSDRRLNG